MHPTLRKPWTAVAEPYPAAFARLIGTALASEAGWTKRKFDIAGCCRANTLRIGEAKNVRLGPTDSLVPFLWKASRCRCLDPWRLAIDAGTLSATG